MKNKDESKNRSKELKRERQIKLERRRSGMIMENSIEFQRASYIGEIYPVGFLSEPALDNITKH